MKRSCDAIGVNSNLVALSATNKLVSIATAFLKLLWFARRYVCLCVRMASV